MKYYIYSVIATFFIVFPATATELASQPLFSSFDDVAIVDELSKSYPIIFASFCGMFIFFWGGVLSKRLDFMVVSVALMAIAGAIEIVFLWVISLCIGEPSTKAVDNGFAVALCFIGLCMLALYYQSSASNDSSKKKVKYEKI